MSQPITKTELTEALKQQTDDIVEALTKRSEAVEDRVDSLSKAVEGLTTPFDGLEKKVDALELSTTAALASINKRLDEVLTAALDYSALEKRVSRIEKRLGVRA